MHKNVKEHAELGDIKWLRYFFRESLDIDPTFEEYKEDYECACKVPGMIVPYQELTPLTDDQTRWDIDYWIKLKRDLMENFSVKRLEHMKKVARVIHADKLERIIKEREKAEIQERKKVLKETKEVKLGSTDKKVTDDSEDIEAKIRQREAEERKKIQKDIEENNKRAAGQRNEAGFTNDYNQTYQQIKTGETQHKSGSSRTSEGSDIDAKKIVGIAVAVVVVGAVIILLVK